MFDRRLIQYFGWGLLGLALLLGLFGLGTLYSVVTAGTQVSQKVLYVKQFIWFSTGLVFMVVSVLFNYKTLERWAPEFWSSSLVARRTWSGLPGAAAR